jgi:amidase
VDKKDVEDGSYKTRNDKEKDTYATYDCDVAQGAPLCLQVVGYVGHEEETMDGMKKIVAAVLK